MTPNPINTVAPKTEPSIGSDGQVGSPIVPSLPSVDAAAPAKDTVRTFDARTWAKSFNETLVQLGHQPHDEGWLIGWFANAIMCGYDERSEAARLLGWRENDWPEGFDRRTAEIVTQSFADEFRRLAGESNAVQAPDEDCPGVVVPKKPTERHGVALNLRHPKAEAAADAFWKYWRENGETHKHGYYESTWGAINRAIQAVGVVPYDYETPRKLLRAAELRALAKKEKHDP